MRTRTKILTGAGAAVLLAGALSAGVSVADDRGHGWRGWHHGPGGGRAYEMFDNFDANGDGEVTAAEVEQVRNERFSQFDADGDGSLSLEEYQALWMDAMRERMVDRFQRHDDDGDAMVTAEEFAEPFGRIVRRLDRDGDGAVTMDEVREHVRGRGYHDDDDDRRRGRDDD